MRLYFTYLIYKQQDILVSVCFLCNVCWMLLQMAKKTMNKHNCVDNISSDIYGLISMSQNNKNITSWCSKQIKLEVLSHIIGSHSPSWLVLGDQWIMNSKYCFNIQYYIDCSMKKKQYFSITWVVNWIQKNPQYWHNKVKGFKPLHEPTLPQIYVIEYRHVSLS